MEENMDMTMQLSRTLKGHEEIFNQGHTLRPRLRQILFSIGNGISFGELRSKLPNCADLESMVDDLLQNGFIESLHAKAAAQSAPAAAPGSPASPPATEDAASNLDVCRNHVLEFMAARVGTKSPAYRQMSEVKDMAGFNTILPMCRRVVAAVASPRQAAEMEAEVARLMGR
jgi:hypothetical protein